jgi:Reverse transcriptase (RNA-dependent DNA polymerase)
MIQLLQAYGVRLNICKFIRNIWTNNTLILQQNQYYGNAMQTLRGVQQGDIMSPTLFNIKVDAVIQQYTHQARLDNKTILQFYANNALIAAVDHNDANT